jgi:hypothetical protein
MTPQRILIAARGKIETSWTQHAAAKNADGDRVAASSAEACSFCSAGALDSVCISLSEHYSQYVQAFSHLRQAAGAASVIEWNDDPKRTKAEVLAAFDKAIAFATGDSVGSRRVAGQVSEIN